MKYRRFGKTGLQVSELGFGCMRLPVIGKDNSRIEEEEAARMIHLAIDHGVNYLDTAYPYHAENFHKGGSSEPFLGRALQNGYRDKVYLATKLPSWLVHSKEDMDRFLTEQLERLDTDHIEFYLLHGLNRATWDKLIGFGVLEFMDKAVTSGKVRYAGFSFHDELDLFKEIVDAYDWSFCQIMYNYFDEDFQAGREGLEYAAARDIGVVAMEPLRGGGLVNGLPQEAGKALECAAPGRTKVDWAFRWLLNQPDVAVVLSGMSTMDQVVENLELIDNFSAASWTAIDQAAIKQVNRIIMKLQKVSCTSCGYCIPCPEGVNIPRNFALCNDHHMLQDPAARNRYYGLLNESQRASNCTRCGECLEKCPQHIAIPDELEQVADLFK